MTVAHRGRGWQLAPALIALEAEADRIAPRRRRTSDGSIGDPAHAKRKSNHNPDGGFVDAFDLSHDPVGGMDAHAHVRAWVARQDPRLEEVISNRRIWTWARRGEGWRPYTGDNAHTLHAHITVKNSHRFDTSPWFSSVVPLPTKPTPPPVTAIRVPEEDDMGKWFRINDGGQGEHHGKVFHVYGREFVHLNAEEWEADQLFHGATAKEVTSTEFLGYVARRRLVDGRRW